MRRMETSPVLDDPRVARQRRLIGGLARNNEWNRDVSTTAGLRRQFLGKRNVIAVLDMCLGDEQDRGRDVMLKYLLIAALLSAPASPQTRTPVLPSEQLDEIRKVTCKGQVPEKFHCAILFDLDFPASGNMIASVVGGFIRQLSLILDGTMYTVAYDPPLKRDDKFLDLRRNVHIPAQVDGEDLIVQWPDGTQAKGRKVRREKIYPNRPQPA